ncbi:Nramp family divalent metal transporter [Aurantimicrobium minutum]|uniref:Nramp family divalent metal transporter n=1 Tax=Aurantimicrobium minutum TaxID=708131 RepID=UPI0024749506|nr:Nramp family divalent metal transporter [Aurantimicrobium minutum]MDH6423541.1 NRAMP (natural resistance-associated macrophage protein)-like metal ion transporter [Aurantimicrobium minutum]
MSIHDVELVDPEDSTAKHHPTRDTVRGRGYFRRLGPGIVTGAADDDPSGIGTYSQVGAATGYRLLWSAPLLLPLAFAVQEACARIALVTGHGLAGVIKARMPRPILYICLALVVIANTVNIAADLGSMSAALQLLIPIPQFLGVILFAAVIVVAEVFVPYHRYAKFLRWLCLSLLAYFAVMFVAKVDWAQVGRDLVVPQFEWTKGDIALLIAIAGTTISPYLFFWQSAEEVEERRSTKHYRVTKTHIQAMRGDVFAGMATGVFAMAAIMITAAATLHKNGVTNIQTAEEAAQALVPIAGDYAGVLFLLGILGTGLLSVPVLAGASSYAMAETFGWRESLERRPSQARAFYAVIFLSILVGLTLNLVGLNPMQFLIIAAITNGLAAPVLMAVIWWIASDEKLLGKWKCPLWSRLLLGIATMAMALLPLLWVLAP